MKCRQICGHVISHAIRRRQILHRPSGLYGAFTSGAEIRSFLCYNKNIYCDGLIGGVANEEKISICRSF